jgi:hypothetical protein
MFRTSSVHHKEDYVVHAALYGMLYMRLWKQYNTLKDVHAQYSLPDDEHMMYEKRRR